MGPHERTGLDIAALERKWANERRQHSKRRQATSAVVEPEECAEAPVLEPVEATKHGMCPLCRSYIERGEAIITADGSKWVHAACAENAGWPVG